MSGVNRYAARQEVLKSSKNQLVKAYMDIVEWFRPRIILMEQVGGVAGSGGRGSVAGGQGLGISCPRAGS
jgi:site-specific DNA-cytosine methylase